MTETNSTKMKVGAVIVAAGSGTRAGFDPPKQFQELCGIPVLVRTSNIFIRHPRIETTVLVICQDHDCYYQSIVAPHLGRKVLTAFGGATRSASVFRGLCKLESEGVTHVLIHDAVRPFVSPQLIDLVISALLENDAVVPGLEVSDALWKGDQQNVRNPVARDGLFRIQTPQGFRLASILEAYRSNEEAAADDAAIAAAANVPVHLVRGCPFNTKLTRREDFAEQSKMACNVPTVRTGLGYDVHAFAPGSQIILCGEVLPFDRSLAGHSDADVASHAIADAVYGALAEGDIGRWFPPTDSRWKDANSMIFLQHASSIAADRGFVIASIDCTIVCEEPKIAPHADAMRRNVANALGVDFDCVSVKATTSEGIGFTGRREGISACCSAMLIAK